MKCCSQLILLASAVLARPQDWETPIQDLHTGQVLVGNGDPHQAYFYKQVTVSLEHSKLSQQLFNSYTRTEPTAMATTAPRHAPPPTVRARLTLSVSASAPLVVVGFQADLTSPSLLQLAK